MSHPLPLPPRPRRAGVPTWPRPLLACALAAVCGIGCGNEIGNRPGQPGIPCGSDLGCGPGEICDQGLCVRAASLAPARDGGAGRDGGVSHDGGPSLDGGVDPDGGSQTDGGATPSFCQPCEQDADCAPLTCVTSESSGERFCSPTCSTSAECPGDALCVNFLVSGVRACFPQSDTCVERPCTEGGCPTTTPLCDTTSGRCYRSEGLAPCDACDYSFQCGGFWDRCIRAENGQTRCGKDCDPARGGQCVSGYFCDGVTAPTGESVQQCVPFPGNTCAECRADNPCPTDQTCDVVTGQCVDTQDVRPPCSPCANNEDCGPTRNTCTGGGCAPFCDAYTPCPAGYECSQVADFELGFLVFRCVPATGQTCERLLYCVPCREHADCNGGRCISVPGGRRCAPRCAATGTADCPQGSTCTPVGEGFSACVPDQGCP